MIGIKDYEASKSEGRSGYSDLDMQVIDASRTDRALKLRGFEVQLCVDGSAKDVTEHLNRFVEHFKKRNAAHKEATQHAIAQGMDADESSSMQQDEVRSYSTYSLCSLCPVFNPSCSHCDTLSARLTLVPC